jgi:hypothetical protein
VVEAKTVVAPALRTAAAASPGAPAEDAAKPAPGQAAKPAAPAPATHPPAAAPATGAKRGASAEKPPQAKDDPSAWETELAQLNLREGARGMLKGTGARPGSVPAAEVGDEDLMALLDGEIGGPAPPPAAPGGEPAPAPAAGAHPPAARTAPAKPAREPKHVEAAAEPAVRERPAERPRETERPRPSRPPAAPRTRSSGPALYVLLGLILLAGGGAAWYFYFQPRMTAAGAGAPAQVGSPPQGTPAGPEPIETPIPTPIGGPSRPQGDGAPGETIGGQVATAGAPGAPDASAPPAAATPQPQSAPPPAAGPAGPAAAAPPSPGPIKPEEAPRLSPEETRRRIAVFTGDGRRLMGQGKWREARAKFNAVLALDPANLDVKEMADQVQAKIDEEQRLQNDMDSAKQLMKDKDFENALRKLYRLPRDKGLGDIDLFIRNAWFNWAVVQLKAGNSKDAINKLNEVLTLDPDDAEAIRLQEVAERYTAKAKDRVYYAFTDTLRLRAFDQRK